MNVPSLLAGLAAALALSACADIPRGPPLTYEGLLPNTHENPVWARDHWPPAVVVDPPPR